MSEDALLKVRKHFANFRSPEKLVEIPVPEWDMSVWYFPHLSQGERRAINIAAQAGTVVDGDAQKVTIDRYGREVMELIVRGRDQHGRTLFHESQFDALLKDGDPDVIAKVIAQMTEDYTDPETVSKN